MLYTTSHGNGPTHASLAQNLLLHRTQNRIYHCAAFMHLAFTILETVGAKFSARKIKSIQFFPSLQTSRNRNNCAHTKDFKAAFHAKYTAFHPMQSSFRFSTFQTLNNSIPLYLFQLQLISSSFFHLRDLMALLSKDDFPLTKNSFPPLSLTPSHQPAPRLLSSSLRAHKDIRLPVVDSPSLSETAGQLLSAAMIQIRNLFGASTSSLSGFSAASSHPNQFHNLFFFEPFSEASCTSI